MSRLPSRLFATRAAVLTAALVAAPLAAQTSAAPSPDPLATLLVRRATTAAEQQRDSLGDTVTVFTMLPALDSAIRRVAPTFTPRSGRYTTMDARVAPGHRAATGGVVLSDLDGDRRLEAVLFGFEGPRTGEAATELVLGVRQVAGRVGADAFAVTLLKRVPDAWQPTGPSAEYEGSALAAVALTATGREVSPRATRLPPTARLAVRYQDVDCKGEGVVFTLRAGVWRTAKSRCTYGE